MSALETVFVMFKADSNQLTKGYKEVNKKTDKLVSGLKGKLLSIFGAAALTAGIKSATDYADNLGKLSDALGENVGDIDAWGGAVEKAGGSAESFQQTTKSLSASLSDFATKGTSRASPFFKKLGVSMTDAHGKARKVMDVLPELADSFSKLSKSEALGMGQRMGIDTGTIMLLQKGRREVELAIKQQKELGVVSKEDARAAADFNDELTDFKHVFREIFVTLARYVLPGLSAFFKLLIQHKVLLFSLIAALTTMAGVFIVMESPIIAIIAALTAVASIIGLLWDDFEHFKNGQKSLIGLLLEKYPLVGKIFSAIGQIMMVHFNLIKDAFLGIVYAFKLLWKAAEKTEEFMENVGKGILLVFQQIVEAIKESIGTVMKGIDAVKEGVNKAKSFIGLGDSKQEIKNATEVIASANSSPLNGMSTQTMNTANNVNRSTSVKTGDIIIKTQADDSKSIASSIGEELKKQLQYSNDFHDDGVYA